MIAVVALIVGDPADRAIVVATLVMFGGGGISWSIGEYLTKRAARPRVDHVLDTRGQLTRGLVIPIREGKARAAVFAQACCGIGAAILAFNAGVFGTQLFMGGIAILLGVLVVIQLRGWRDPHSYIALTPEAMHIRSLGSHTSVPWQAVRGVIRGEAYGQPLLGVNVTHTESISREGGAAVLGRLERPLAGADINIPVVGMALSADELHRLVRHVVDAPAVRRDLADDTAASAILDQARAPGAH